MGTLSSSISSLASSTYLDLLKEPLAGLKSGVMTPMRWSKLLTVVWGAILIGGAMLFTDATNPVVELGLKIASFTYGGLLGTFLLGLFFRSTTTRDGAIGFTAGILTMSAVLAYTRIDFTWHTLIGCSATVTAGVISNRIFRPGSST